VSGGTRNSLETSSRLSPAAIRLVENDILLAMPFQQKIAMAFTSIVRLCSSDKTSFSYTRSLAHALLTMNRKMVPDRHQRWALKTLGNLGGFAQIANGSFVRRCRQSAFTCTITRTRTRRSFIHRFNGSFVGLCRQSAIRSRSLVSSPLFTSIRRGQRFIIRGHDFESCRRHNFSDS
jgi:hypothetical protein